MEENKKYIEIKKEVIKDLLHLYKKANAGHIGSSLSCIDILIYIFFFEKKINDQFILSKGHAAAGLYTVLSKSGFFPKELLQTFYNEGTILAAHPPCNGQLNGITFGTGSLGHGISLSTGIALSAQFKKEEFNVYCVVSDGDLNEGSSWEAILFAAQHKLKNLIVIVDYNKIQGFGKAENVINLESISSKFNSFHFDVSIAENGNDYQSLKKSFEEIKKRNSDKPKCIIANTVKGSSVSYMENKMEWHYLPMNEEQFAIALKEIESLQ